MNEDLQGFENLAGNEKEMQYEVRGSRERLLLSYL